MTIASVLLALLTATSSPASDLDRACLARLPRRMVRTVPQAAPGRRAVDPQGISDQDDRHRPGGPSSAQRYHVDSVPTFIVVDGSGRELDRTAGLQSAAELARFYKAAAAKAQPPANSNAHTSARATTPAHGTDDNDDQAESPTENPAGINDDDRDERDNERSRAGLYQSQAMGNRRPDSGPRQPLDRLRLGHDHSQHARGIAHPDLCPYLQAGGRKSRSTPSEFPRQIMIDLFDGNLQGPKPAKVHFLEAVEGWAVDYDFDRDVGLIRIRPGRRLPACRVVPAHWQPTIADAGPHGRLLGRTRRDSLAHHHQPSADPEFLVGKPDLRSDRMRRGTQTGALRRRAVHRRRLPRGRLQLRRAARESRPVRDTSVDLHVLDRNNLMALYAPVSRGQRRAGGRWPYRWPTTAEQPSRSPASSVARPRRSSTKPPRRQRLGDGPIPQLGGRCPGYRYTGTHAPFSFRHHQAHCLATPPNSRCAGFAQDEN